MKLIIYTFLILQCLNSQCQSDLSGEWNTKTFPDFRYNFDESGNVEFQWLNDLGSYKRIGKYKTNQDSVFITYDPVFKFERVDSLRSFGSLSIQVFEPHEYLSVVFKVFRKDRFQIVRPDSTGYLTIKQPSGVDSIYFDNNVYLTNSFYQIPKDLITSNHLAMKIDRNLMNYKLKSNKAILIRVNDEEIYNGGNYDPEINYVGGILTRKTKINKN